MKWNWIKDGGLLPTEYDEVLCYCADTDYSFVGYRWVNLRGSSSWSVVHNDQGVNPPDAWCYIEGPVKPDHVLTTLRGESLDT